MSNSAEPIVAYGFNLGPEPDMEDEDVLKLIEEWENKEPGDWPIELVRHGHYDYTHIFVAIRGSKKRGWDWGATVNPLDLVLPTPGHEATAKAWCEEHGIAWQEPKLLAMAYYG
jgi:hypothetical protein